MVCKLYLNKACLTKKAGDDNVYYVSKFFTFCGERIKREWCEWDHRYLILVDSMKTICDCYFCHWEKSQPPNDKPHAIIRYKGQRSLHIKVNRDSQETHSGASLITEAGIALSSLLGMPGSYHHYHHKTELNPQSYTSRYEARRDIYSLGSRIHST